VERCVVRVPPTTAGTRQRPGPVGHAAVEPAARGEAVGALSEIQAAGSCRPPGRWPAPHRAHATAYNGGFPPS